MKQMIRWHSFLSIVLLTLCLVVAPANARNRPVLNAEGTTFVGDNGNLLRGPFASTEWGDPPPYDNIEDIKELGCNAIHLYGECYDPDYPDPGSDAPGYSFSRIDDMVDMTRELGLYLVITIGNGSNNGAFNYDYVMDFWDFYAPRYKDETHVLYEIQNEPYAWGPNYDQATLDMEADAYTLIRSHAPDTPILLFSYAVLVNGAAAVADIASVSAAASVDWSNAGVAFHGYGGHFDTPDAVEYIIAAGYPCVMTEFAAYDWGGGHGLDVELASELERLNISWLNFLHIPPNFISSAITDPDAFKDMVDRAGMSWAPDFGYWPVARGVYGNGGQPRETTTNWSGNFLTGTLRIEAEDFDIGGQDVAYNDTDSSNNGGQYRTSEGVDITSCGDTGGGYKVGWTVDEEWLEYTIWVKEPGFYDLDLRYATPNSGCTVQVICNDRDKTGAWTLSNTGGYENWSTATKEVFLEYGRQKLRLEISTGGFDLNWIELTPASTGPVANGTYKLMNRNSGMAMEYDTGSDHVVQEAYSGANIQKWNLQHLGAGQYKVTSALNNDSWNVWSGPGNSLDLVWWWNINSRHQRFIVRPIGYGYYRIAPADRGFDFEVEGASKISGAAILQNEFMGNAHQQWGVLSPSAPAFPTSLSAMWVSSSLIDLTWTDSAGATSYNVKRSTTSGGPYTTIDTVAITNYSDTDVTEGTIYYYVVSANTAGGESLISNEAEANPSSMHAYLRFDETSGTTASDSTGNGWNGTLVSGPTWTTGKYHNAVNLDGTNDYVSLPTGVVDGLTDFTISTWVNLDVASEWSRIFDFGNDTTVNMFLTPRAWTGRLRFAITTGGGGGEQIIDGDDPFPSGAWTHVAVTLAGNTGILYVNGDEVGRNSSMSLTPDSLGATTQNYIGKSQYSWDAYLNGRVDDFRIYPSALNPTEVDALASNDEPYFTSNPIVKSDAIEDAVYTGQTLVGDASDPDSDPLTFSKVSGPAWLTVAANGSLSGIPSDSDVGVNVFTVRIEDTFGLYDTAGLNIYVANIYSGVRGSEDLEGFTAQWLNTGCADTPACDGADLDGDKDVDFLDFAIFANNWLAE